jgi:hypothetical protein
MATKKILKKAQKGTTVKPTRDSTGYYRNQAIRATSEQDFDLERGDIKSYKKNLDREKAAKAAQARQANKGKPGYDKNGFPLPKIQSGAKGAVKLAPKKNGGSIKRKK